MNWNLYEEEIYKLFQKEYPYANISHNTKIDGKYSTTKRQIYILIEDMLLETLYE